MLRRSTRSVIGGLCIAALTLGVGACSDDDKNSDVVTRTTPAPGGNAATGSGLPDDACALLSAKEVKDALGVAAKGQVEDRAGSGSKAPQVKGCTWGKVTADSGLIAVQVSATDPKTGIDYLKSVVKAGGEGSPIDIGEEGQLVQRAHIPYGGGVGLSVMFTNDGNTVVVATTKASQDKTEAAAKAVLANLNR